MISGSLNSLADALIRQMNLQLEDMRYNGEYPFLLSLIQSQSTLSQKVSQQQEALAEVRKRVSAILTASRPKQQSDPVRIQKAYKVLEDTLEATRELQRNIGTLEAKLKEISSMARNKDEVRRAALELANHQNAVREELIELYHSISGVHWDQPDLGYVLSEEIAKPIRFDSCLDATNQLWEMINM